MQIMNEMLNDFLYGFSKILKDLPDAVFIVEKNGRISWVNDKATAIYNCRKRDLKKRMFDDLVDKGLEKVEQSIKTQNPVIAGTSSPDAKEFFIELNAKLHHGRYVVTIRDITAITNVFENTAQTNMFNKEKNAMLVKLANEFKSPVNSVIGFTQTLLDGIGGKITKKQDKYLNIINKSSKDFLYFMDRFIEFAYAESTLYECEYQTFDVVNAIQNIIKNSEEETAEKGLSVEFDYEELQKRTVYSDEKTLKTILQNLFASSIRMTESGSITFKVFTPDPEFLREANIFRGVNENSLLQISITDTGVGLQENEMDTLFEPYEELEKPSRKNVVRSFNLGTASILAKRLNGIVWAESEVMKGTTFNVIIPIEKETNE